MIKKFLTLLFCSAFLYADPNTLIVGTNSEFPPFSFIENKEIIGFDIDIAKAIAEKLQKKITFKDMPFDALIPELALGKVDFVAAGLSYTEERAKRVLFTRSYLDGNPLVIFTKKDSPLTLQTLTGKTVVVIEGYVSDLYISNRKDINLIRLATQADGFMAIKTARADAFITAQSTIASFLSTQEASEFTTNFIEETGETCSIAVPKNKQALLEEIQKALDTLEQEGTLAQIKAKWKLS